MFHGCTRLAVKARFHHAGLLLKAVDATGSKDSAACKAGRRVLAWRNLFWGLTDAMARTTTPWTPGYVLDRTSITAWRIA